MAHFYLVEGALPAEGGLAVLEGSEAKHAAQVSRVRVGERLRVGDGRGTVAEGPVESASPVEVTIRIEHASTVARPSPRVVLVQALAKGDRDELAVQAATELGVDEIVPWQAERSVSRWDGPKAVKGRERWRAIVREATKQSIRPWLPEVRELTTTKGLLALAAESRMLVLDPGAELPLPGALRAVASGARELVVVVGPEGGVSPAELAALTGAGATAARLGPEVLRTSTAGPAALAAISALLGRWS